jgi:hypothetical protein
MQRTVFIASASLFVGGLFLYQVFRLYYLKGIAESQKKREEEAKKFIDDSVARRRMAILCSDPFCFDSFTRLFYESIVIEISIEL